MKSSRKASICRALVASAKKQFLLASEDAISIAPYSPSPMSMVHGVWERLSEEITRNDYVVELGCGDARWIIAAVERFACSAMGVEWDVEVAKMAMERTKDKGLQDAIEIRIQDMLARDFCLPKDTTIVIVYAFANTLNVNIKALLMQCKPNTRVISVGFHVQGWHPKWTQRYGGLCCYYYDALDGQKAGIGDSKR
ncbi:hypothetical protein THRCLA_20736 [Thraustotheca clavata]|uniref:Methyltransferase domain-containing protein n=1 Tax=Thraustotheca clavata TaxID=74557 RepID=A0A1W0A483_9STRA|nr:hypothetical protein THRCLA_20736 [Thraustotheca clavata]